MRNDTRTILQVCFSLAWLVLDVDAQLTDQAETLYLAGIMDTTSYFWCPDIFEFTVERLNAGYDNILREGQTLNYTLVNSNCDETTAVTLYWNLRTLNGDTPPDGIVGARCSGASVSLARMSQQEQVPHLSPSSNSAKLSNNEEFPYFSRLVAPNDETGEVGALNAMLDHFGWQTVTVLSTDTQFAKDLTTEFRTLFGGSVAYADTIPVQADGSLRLEEVDATLEKIPTGHEGSRIILLAAHNQHASKVLQRAKETGFQPDSVWVGPSSWVGRLGDDGNEAFDLTDHPGYVGVVPYRNRDSVYQEFLSEFQAWQQERNKIPLDDLPAFAAETADSIVAMTQALASHFGSTESTGRNGEAVVGILRGADFAGVSGRVQFTSEGDRKDPQYSIFHAHKSIGVGSTPFWNAVGSVGTQVGSVDMAMDQLLCFPGSACVHPSRTDLYPLDLYPEPPLRLPGWAVAMFVVFSFLLVAMTFKYWRSRSKKSQLKKELETFRGSFVGIRASECDYIPLCIMSENDEGSDDRSSPLMPPEQATLLSHDTADAQRPTKSPAIWCWKETPTFMKNHSASEVFGDPADCWIKYTEEASKLLEESLNDGKSEQSPLQGYVVNFGDMKQTKTSTKFQRDVKRVVSKKKSDTPLDIKSEGVRIGDILPVELQGEPQMVLIEGDVVQISKERDDGWAFGTKLHHADEVAARDLLALATAAKDDEMGPDASISNDSGWFPLDCTRLPTTDDLKAIKQNIGDTGDLGAPAYWDPIVDETIVQRHLLDPNTNEYSTVHKDFVGSLGDKTVNVIKIERVQNLAMWQSYITICSREIVRAAGEQKPTNSEDDMRRALDRYERSWLWHGTNVEVMDKIQQQGFNRSFCGKNATAYGKGVYFARNSSYSANPLYAVPGKNGHQYILACRVAVGEYCKGRFDVITPDVRDHKSHLLYDSTVDYPSRPSIYVTYHDAQAYPEYLITFKKSTC